jgi:iron complex transport system permease protein
MVNNRRARISIVVIALLVMLLITIILELSWAPRRLTFEEIWDVLRGAGTWANSIIMLEINAPRVALGFFVGAGLGVAGAVMQAIFRNPMASPYILGLSSGASLGAAIGMLFTVSFIPVLISVPLLAFVFCVGTMFLVYSLSRVGNVVSMETLLLSGIAVGALLQALVSLLTYMSGDKLEDLVFWGMGSISGANWSEIAIVATFVTLGSLVMISYAKEINAMMMGDAHAMDLGVNVRRTRLILLLASSLVTAAAVSFAGVIGFVGLIIPHILRILIGPDNRALLPLCMLGGGTYLIACDYVAHVITPNLGILPIGIITALIGAPYFIYLLRRKKSGVGW